MVPELHAMRIVCLFKAVAAAWVTNTFPILLVIDYIDPSGSFKMLQAKVKCLSLVGSVRPVPCALKKHYFARGGLTYISFMYFI